MRLSIYEQGTVDLAPSMGSGRSAIDLDAATAIVEAGQKLGVRVATWDNPTRVRFHQFVGLVVVDDLQVEVLPKVDGWSSVTKARQALLHMLAVAHDLDVKPSDVAACVAQEEPVLASLARIYVMKLAEALRRGLRQEYRHEEERLSRIRGKVDWGTQLRLDLTHIPAFACRFDDRSEDTALNRVLKAALRQSERLLADDGLGSLGLEIRHALEGVADVRLTTAQLNAVHLDRMSRHLAPLLTLAKLLLGQANPDFGEACDRKDRTFALIWDMNTLFETFIAKVALAELEPRGIEVLLQSDAGLFLGTSTATGRKVFALRPDVLVRGPEVGSIVIDTKWKGLDPAAPHWDVSSGDVYQVNVYAQQHQAGTVILAYPHAHGYGAPGEKARYLLNRPGGHPVTLLIVTLDLANLDGISPQIVAMVGAGPKSQAVAV